MMKTLVIAAPQSGSGKTTVTLGLLALLTRRGQRVAPFKAGPDFIDPGYHRLITGRPSVNLDSWICPSSFVRETFRHHTGGCDWAVIEGVMGLFDGLGATADQGSTAAIARLTGAPVLLVVNARGMAASAAALMTGFARFDPAVRLAGVVFNNVGSERHAQLLARAMADHCPDVPFLGALPRDEELVIPSRHLGLVTAADNPLPAAFVDRLADAVERHINLELLERCCCSGTLMPVGEPVEWESAERQPVPIAVARDRAFCFLYEDNLRLMRRAGLEPCFFSPLADRVVPPGCRGIYLPGGYPELHREELAENRPMLAALRAAVATGLPVYAECGGLVYLTNGIADSEGMDADDPAHPFVGVFPVTARMGTRRAALGYREVTLLRDCLLGGAGELVRGHEFHYSRIGEMPAGIRRDYRVSRPGEAGWDEGYGSARCLASYVHLHFGSNPATVAALAAACRA
ncbi:cobyrinate a,c-diamide synthase [Trichlorobacter ammonificans]|uniref:Cobyrinate a,c-diamide synthase n=2 Tax=Trichlorobacter ammonificans TaxID=2916410 RepID=A0ABM9D952_9BACT|nr:cobyrinate a,c-diamide synthase [Trichlorobacter ammonificans]CAH2031760.1 Cobyrinate a,c-diamide synthase [Trichlorobacter ammonificans]